MAGLCALAMNGCILKVSIVVLFGAGAHLARRPEQLGRCGCPEQWPPRSGCRMTLHAQRLCSASAVPPWLCMEHRNLTLLHPNATWWEAGHTRRPGGLSKLLLGHTARPVALNHSATS